jgi:hypothetical protein
MTRQLNTRNLQAPCPLDRTLIKDCVLTFFPAPQFGGGRSQTSQSSQRASKLDPHFVQIAACVFERADAEERGASLRQHSLEAIAKRIHKQTGVQVSASGLLRYLRNHPLLRDITKWN